MKKLDQVRGELESRLEKMTNVVKEDQAEMVALVVVENYKSIDYYLSYNIIIN